MTRIDDLTPEPGIPGLLLSEANDVPGLDLLGLRAPAEAIANRLMDGVTTVTPAVRYLAFRAWLILRYLELGGIKNWEAFSAFAAKAEAVVAYGSQLAEDQTSGVVGRNGAAVEVNKSGASLTLKRLTRILAINVYGGPSEALGLGESSGDVPTLTSERGLPLAEAFGADPGVDDVLKKVSLEGEGQSLERSQLINFGTGFTIARPSPSERSVLIEAIIPKKAREKALHSELNRIASYCLLLHLSTILKRVVQEEDVHKAVSQFSLAAIPLELHPICDGWSQFVVRDLLVLIHEAAVANVLRQLSQAVGLEKRQSAQQVIQALVSQDIDSGLVGLGLNLNSSQPIRDLCVAVKDAFGETQELRGIRRWSGKLSETLLLEKQAWLHSADGLGLLPVAWVIAANRLGPGIRDEKPQFDLNGQTGFSRIGVGAVVVPEVDIWVTSTRSVRDVTGWLIQRSVEQHLRIAWSRLAREPYKDVGLIRSDGDDWIYQKGFGAGRATSRLYQAVNWLRQLELLDESGISAKGAEVLSDGLATLRQGQGETK